MRGLIRASRRSTRTAMLRTRELPVGLTPRRASGPWAAQVLARGFEGVAKDYPEGERGWEPKGQS